MPDATDMIVARVGAEVVFARDVITPTSADWLGTTSANLAPEQVRDLKLRICSTLIDQHVETLLVVVDACREIPADSLREIRRTADKEFEDKMLPKLMQEANVGNRLEYERLLRAKSRSLDRSRELFFYRWLANKWTREQAAVGPVRPQADDKKRHKDAHEAYLEKLRDRTPVWTVFDWKGVAPHPQKISPKTLSALIAKEGVEIPLLETLELISEPDGSATEDVVIPKRCEKQERRQKSSRFRHPASPSSDHGRTFAEARQRRLNDRAGASTTVPICLDALLREEASVPHGSPPLPRISVLAAPFNQFPMNVAAAPRLIAVGGVCATGVFRVATVSPLPAKALANRMCRIADGMAVSAIDTLAAGDVFHGALALAILEGQPIAAAARLACTAATLKCGRFGGRLGCPTRAEVETALTAAG